MSNDGIPSLPALDEYELEKILGYDPDDRWITEEARQVTQTQVFTQYEYYYVSDVEYDDDDQFSHNVWGDEPTFTTYTSGDKYGQAAYEKIGHYDQPEPETQDERRTRKQQVRVTRQVNYLIEVVESETFE